MREVNKLTTVYVTHSDHANEMHTHSDHGNEKQRIINMCNDILCDGNGFIEPCPLDILYTVDHMSPYSGLLSKH